MSYIPLSALSLYPPNDLLEEDISAFHAPNLIKFPPWTLQRGIHDTSVRSHACRTTQHPDSVFSLTLPIPQNQTRTWLGSDARQTERTVTHSLTTDGALYYMI